MKLALTFLAVSVFAMATGQNFLYWPAFWSNNKGVNRLFHRVETLGQPTTANYLRGSMLQSANDVNRILPVDRDEEPGGPVNILSSFICITLNLIVTLCKRTKSSTMTTRFRDVGNFLLIETTTAITDTQINPIRDSCSTTCCSIDSRAPAHAR